MRKAVWSRRRRGSAPTQRRRKDERKGVTVSLSWTRLQQVRNSTSREEYELLGLHGRANLVASLPPLWPDFELDVLLVLLKQYSLVARRSNEVERLGGGKELKTKDIPSRRQIQIRLTSSAVETAFPSSPHLSSANADRWTTRHSLSRLLRLSTPSPSFPRPSGVAPSPRLSDRKREGRVPGPTCPLRKSRCLKSARRSMSRRSPRRRSQRRRASRRPGPTLAYSTVSCSPRPARASSGTAGGR